MFELKNFSVFLKNKRILNKINLIIKKGELHVIMGPNGAGKTTLALSLMGEKKFKIQNSKFKINGKDILKLETDDRAKNGLFVSFQNPIGLKDVSVLSFLRASFKEVHPNEEISFSAFKKKAEKILETVGLNHDFLKKSLNEDFSGGEKKRMELVQFMVLAPQFAIFDEIDSGLDMDGIIMLSKIVKKTIKECEMGILLITHSQNIFKYLKPDFIHILINGEIKNTGDIKLLKKIERVGYEAI